MQKNITAKIVSLLALMLFIAVANVAVIYFYQAQQKHSARIVNVAGRQRMLSQRISKLVLSVANTEDADRKPLSKAIRLYDDSLESLWHGGEAMEGDIPSAPRVMEGLFRENKNLWTSFKEKADIVVKIDRYNSSFKEAIEYIRDNNEALLKASDDVVTAYDVLPDASEYTHEVNVAGRQRMLSQKMSKQAFAIAIGENEDRQNLQEAIELYEMSLLAMLNGGASIPWNNEMSPPPSSVKNTLKDVEDIWRSFKVKISIIQKNLLNNKVFIEAVGYIESNNDELLKISDTITLTFDRIFSGKILFLRVLLLVMLGIDVLVFIIGCLMAVNIVKPLKALSVIAMKIGGGDFTAKAQITTDDEIGKLAASFNKMTESLRVSIQKEKELVIRTATVEAERKRADELNQLKTQFVANVSHEFKNPLTIAKESLEVVLSGDAGSVTSDQKKMLEIGKGTIERLIRLVTNLLDISKIESGKVDMKRDHLDIAALLEGVLKTYTLEFSKKQIALNTNISQNAGMIWGDEDKLKQVAINILSNAIKYTPEGGTVSVGLVGDEKEVRCEISDTGPGLSKEDRSKIFDKFERVTAEKAEGTGLGLPIAKDIVELHKGKLWVESKSGKGSMFVITLPRDSAVVKFFESIKPSS